MHRVVGPLFRSLVLLVFAAAWSAVPPCSAETEPPPHGAGIAVLASDIGDAHSVEDLLAFVEAARIHDVVVDWAWITLHWDRTDFEAIEALVKALRERDVRVAAMYRPRFKEHEIAKYAVAYQVDASAAPRGGYCEIRYSDAEARKWGTRWAVEILERCPSFDEVVIYNPTQHCQSPEVAAARTKTPGYDDRCVETFLSETRKAMRAVKKGAKLGLVLPPRKERYDVYAKVVDVVRPFVFVREGADIEGDQDAALEVIWGNRDAGAALAKITWGADDTVSDAFLGAFIRAARKNRIRFVFWTFWTTFCDGRYDLDLLCKALDLDAQTIKPLIKRLGGKVDVPWDPDVVRRAVRDAADDTSVDAFQTMQAVAVRFGEDAVEPLCVVLLDRSESDDVRWRAASALRRIGSVKALESLLIGSRDASAAVRWLCAEALGSCGTGSIAARDRLLEMARDDPAWREDPETGGRIYYARETARTALERLAQSSGAVERFLAELPWADTLEEAQARARIEKRFVIAFVNPFDRDQFVAGWKDAPDVAKKALEKQEEPEDDDVGLVKERAMLVGMLAEPRMAAFARDHCVLVRVRLSTFQLSPAFRRPPPAPLDAVGLRPLEIGPPAIVVYSPTGKVLAHASHLAFFAPELMHAICGTDLSAPDPSRETALVSAETDLLRGRVDQARRTLERARPPKSQIVRHAALLTEALLRLGDVDAAAEAARSAGAEADSSWRTRLAFFRALALDRSGNIADARLEFAQLALDEAPGPWRARASLYVATDGPNPREWCPFGNLALPPILRSTESGENAAAPDSATRDTLRGAIQRAARYLLERRRPDRVWEGPKSTPTPMGGEPGDDRTMVPRAALCVCALDAALPHLDTDDKRRAEAAIASGRAFVGRWSESPDRNIWSLTYALHMELHFFPRTTSGERRAAKTRIHGLVAALADIEQDGGWTYARVTRRHTFNTAPILLALCQVKKLRLADVDAMLTRAATFLESQRLGKASLFHYGTEMQHLTKKDAPQGSSMRSPLCELALLEAGGGDARRLEEGLELFFRHLDDVRSTAKKFESWFEPSVMHDAYHYYFGTWYAAQATARIDKKPLRRKLAERLAAEILATQELDGGYVDAQVTSGRNASTAMALMTLVECAAALR